MEKDKMINVFGCSRCKKLAGDMTGVKSVQGYPQCPTCRGDLDYFWLNLTQMKFQESRQVTPEEATEMARVIWGKCNDAVDDTESNFPIKLSDSPKSWWRKSTKVG